MAVTRTTWLWLALLLAPSAGCHVLPGRYAEWFRSSPPVPSPFYTRFGGVPTEAFSAHPNGGPGQSVPHATAQPPAAIPPRGESVTAGDRLPAAATIASRREPVPRVGHLLPAVHQAAATPPAAVEALGGNWQLPVRRSGRGAMTGSGWIPRGGTD